MLENKKLYIDFFKDSLHDLQHSIDAKITALDEFARKLQNAGPASDLRDILKHKDDIEVLRATSTDQLIELRNEIDVRIQEFAQKHATV